MGDVTGLPGVAAAAAPRGWSARARSVRRLRCVAVVATLLVALGAPGWAEAPQDEPRVLLLYTNDIHDHVRPGADGVGGLPWVAGYVAGVRAQRDDVLLLDAGDAAEKGDLVAFLTHSELTFEAMGRIGYDAIAVGNHEHNLGLNQLRRLDALTGHRLLALNFIGADGLPMFAPSRVFERGGARIAVIGMALPRTHDTLDFAASAQALGRHAVMLREQAAADLVVVVAHVGTEDASRWSRAAPEVDVFVTGHTHQTLEAPLRVPETGALLVQAGANARKVGRLELALRHGERPDVLSAEIVVLDHERSAPDEAMLAWIKQREAELAPGAGEVVVQLEAPLGWFAIARLSAAAIRHHAQADIGLYHPTHVVRNPLVPGAVTVNDLFRAASDRGHPLVEVELSGTEIEAYLLALARRDPRRWGETQWSGFRVTRSGDGALTTDLETSRRYRVVMPQREWEKRFLRLTEQLQGAERDGPLAARAFTARPAGFSSVDALAGYLADLPESVEQTLARLAAAQGDADPLEATAEALFMARTYRNAE
ncbi:MAG: bifunctional metallophosphatase/5'-nucleotidase [Gammaproteobacteria bacterium]|nr:MAG: bifunctional metallophosphatase/5'-nucleotidase [Gammaproteobacteria bacterium]